VSASRFERHSPPVDAGFPDEWYEMSSKDHFWYRFRMQALDGFLSRLPIPRDQPLRALEIGCGTGLLRSQIEERTGWTIDGADLNQAALEGSVPSRGRTLLYNILDLKEEFTGRYDVVILFDVIEHIVEPDAFLRAAFKHLKPGGWMLVNVPALTLLFSKYDVVVGHQRRYDKRTLSEEFTSRGLGTVKGLSYWGFLLVPLAMMRRVVLAFVHRRRSVVSVGFKPMSPLVNQALVAAMAVEGALFKDPPLGTSVLAAVQAPA
jgi:SAM-dependent methyltransferase